MPSEYDTVQNQRVRMLDSLCVGIICLAAVVLNTWLAPEEPFGYVFGFGAIVGFYGFFNHRRYMKELKRKEERTSLLEMLNEVLEPNELEGITEEQLEPMRREIEFSMMAAAFGDPRGVADLLPDIRMLKAQEKDGR